MPHTAAEHNVDIVLVGGGVMSATLATLLAQLAPRLQIILVEQQDEVATESSDAWNNAGTGHAGYCELNYTPQTETGIDIRRALNINAAYEVSLQFWASLVTLGVLPEPASFIHPTPHLSFVQGTSDVAFLRARHALLQQHPLFADMEYSEDAATLARWMPLVMQQRPSGQTLAATRLRYGTDVDFGALTQRLVTALQQQPNFQLRCRQRVRHLRRHGESRWRVTLQDRDDGTQRVLETGFVFLGAGGATLPLLQASGIVEGKGYGGFPVSGRWLVCQRDEVIRQHHAKVYGKAPLGAPPMSVPHLDTRYINGRQSLLFGPFAGFSGKFLKRGSALDLLKSVRPDNLKPLLGVAAHRFDLTRYLVREVMQSHESRMESLRRFYPQAQSADWKLAVAGQRVQIIKPSPQQGGKLEFGTEIVTAADGSLAALLGASPGASVAVQAMLELLQRCFGGQMATAEWRARLQALIPSYGHSLVEDADLLRAVRKKTLDVLALDERQA